MRGGAFAVVATLATPPAGAAAQEALLPPVTPACISSPFGERPAGGPRASRMHNGLDLPAPAGAWVRAAAAGRVVSVRRIGAWGWRSRWTTGTG